MRTEKTYRQEPAVRTADPTPGWGADARNRPGFREALIESAVCLNAAQAAYNLHLEVERAGKWEIEVLYGIYDLYTHRVSVPNGMEKGIHLAYAPTNPRDFKTLALQIAEVLKPNADVQPVEPPPGLDSFEGAGGDKQQH